MSFRKRLITLVSLLLGFQQSGGRGGWFDNYLIEHENKKPGDELDEKLLPLCMRNIDGLVNALTKNTGVKLEI